jgi:transketolase
VDGANIAEIYNAIIKAKETKGKPHLILLDTIKGQGFSYLEQKENTHHLRPDEKEQAIIKEYIALSEKELEILRGELENA